jgi:hypothetical protein
MSGWRKKQIAIKEELAMELDFLENDDGMQLNYGNIAMAEWLCPTIRLAALDLQKNPYIAVGDWFQKQSNNSIAELQHMAEVAYENPDDPENEEIEQLMLLTMMLAAAEGSDNMGDMAHLQKQLSKLVMLITVVSLQRKGLVRVFYENLTLGADMDDAKIAEKL